MLKTITKTIDFTELKNISTKELTNMFLQQEIKGTNFIQVITKTEPKMRKTNNPFFDKVYKITNSNCQIGWFYDKAVINRRIKEGKSIDFEMKKRSWGKHIVNHYNNKISKTMIEHTNKNNEYNQYVQLRTLNVKSIHYIFKDSKIKLPDNLITELKTFMPKRKKSISQDVNNDIIVSDYNIKNILSITMNKIKYNIYK